MLRPGIVGMRGSMGILLRPSMISSTTPPALVRSSTSETMPCDKRAHTLPLGVCTVHTGVCACNDECRTERFAQLKQPRIRWLPVGNGGGQGNDAGGICCKCWVSAPDNLKHEHCFGEVVWTWPLSCVWSITSPPSLRIGKVAPANIFSKYFFEAPD